MVFLQIKELKRAPGMVFPLAGVVELPTIEHDGLKIASKTSISFKGEAVYRQERIYLTLKIEAQVERECSRCLKHYTVSIQKEERIALREEGEVGLEDDEFPYPDEADELDLRPYLKSLVISSLPPKPLCDPRCRGICPYCGVNLNEEDHRSACPALQREVDPRLAPLSKLL